MKRKINVTAVNELMKNRKQKELASYLHMPESNLSSGLKENGRTISMDYVLAIAKFLKVKPSEITVEVKKDETNHRQSTTRL